VLGLKQLDKNITEAAQMSFLSKLMGVSKRQLIMCEETGEQLGAAGTAEETQRHVFTTGL
jgi:hypothetical protein